MKVRHHDLRKLYISLFGGDSYGNMEIRTLIRRSGSDTKYQDPEIDEIRTELIPDAEYRSDMCTRYSVRVTNDSVRDLQGIIHIKVMTEAKAPKFFMPGYMYNTNTADMPSSGRKAFPRLKCDPSGKPESDFFMTRSDRLALPLSLVFDEGRVIGIAAPPYWLSSGGESIPVSFANGKKDVPDIPFLQYSGFSCNINDDGMVSVGYTLGYENAPWLFVQTANVIDRRPLDDDNSFTLRAGESITFPMYIYDYKGEDERSVYKAMEHCYFAFHETPREIHMDDLEAAALLSSAIRDNAWLEDDKMYSGFVYDNKTPRFNKIGSLSWTNGMAVACPMLLAADLLGDDKAREQSLAFIGNVVKNSYNLSSGFLYDAVENGIWSVKGWWYNGMHSGGHSSYINGQAAYYILCAFEAEKKRGVSHEDWIEFVKPVIKRMNEVVNSDHEYPFSMSDKTGAGLEYDSLGSVWCLAATLLYEQILGDDEYIGLGIKIEQHYYDAFVKLCECYGGPLDTDKAVDDEGILAFIRSVRILHEITGEDHLLGHLKDALDYEFSFKLSYNTPVSVPPLSNIGWSSCGGSITSTANPHIHPMSSTIIPEMRYYARLTGDRYVLSRLEDTVRWSRQTFNTYKGEYGYGDIGWMSERFCFCEGLLTERYPDGSPASTWFALMPWAGASLIEGFVRV